MIKQIVNVEFQRNVSKYNFIVLEVINEKINKIDK